MKIAIIGIGNVGGTLAKAFGLKGHSLYLGARDPNSKEAKELANQIGPLASIHTPAEALSRAEVVLLATPWSATLGWVKEVAALLEGKIVMDCTNPLKSDLSGLELGHHTSGAEAVQSAAPGAHVFKAFNTVGYNIMENPVLEGRRAAMYFCGDDLKSRHQVQELIQDVGFEVIDAGPLSSARLLEPLALLWISSAYRFGLGRDFAFNILRRKS
jgi:predicted dinucleotide-binding enzyme